MINMNKIVKVDLEEKNRVKIEWENGDYIDDHISRFTQEEMDRLDKLQKFDSGDIASLVSDEELASEVTKRELVLEAGGVGGQITVKSLMLPSSKGKEVSSDLIFETQQHKSRIQYLIFVLVGIITFVLGFVSHLFLW